MGLPSNYSQRQISVEQLQAARCAALQEEEMDEPLSRGGGGPVASCSAAASGGDPFVSPRAQQV